MNDHELLQRARDALYAMQQSAMGMHCGLKICDDTIINLDARLAQPALEPQETK